MKLVSTLKNAWPFGLPKVRLNTADSRSISVIITSYNVSGYINECIRSVLSQNFPIQEIIMVDDGSSDETINIAMPLLKQAPKSHLIIQPNKGPGSARNTGIALATSEYIIFVDGDDSLGDKAVSSLMSDNHKEDIIFSNRIRFHEKTNQLVPEIIFRTKKNIPIFSCRECLRLFSVHGKAFRRSFLIENSIIFPEGISSEDFVFSYLCYSKAKKVSSISTPTYIYRKRSDCSNRSLTQMRLSTFNIKSRIKQIEATQALVNSSSLRLRFPFKNFRRLDYEFRLMRHLKHLPKQSINRAVEIFEIIRPFLKQHKKRFKGRISKEVLNIYCSIIEASSEKAINQIIEYNARKDIIDSNV